MAIKYFEDIQVGEKFTTPARTVTLQELNAYLGLTDDLHPLHTSAEYVQRFGFQKPLVPGVYILGILTGLEPIGTGWSQYIALAGITEARFIKPVAAGDTIKAKGEVLAKRETRKPDRGILTIKLDAINQKGEVVATFTRLSMMQRRPKQ